VNIFTIFSPRNSPNQSFCIEFIVRKHVYQGSQVRSWWVIDFFSQDVKKIDDQDFETNYDEIFDSFDNMPLTEDLLRGIYAYGFEKPSAIQSRAIKPLATERHIIAQAQSGTGKTATFTIGILQQLDYSKNVCQALVLAPTRELAQQIQKVSFNIFPGFNIIY
jgi:superfamily II DNA/RNA helicase